MIVESGENLTNADSYVSVEFADNYFNARAITEWAELTEEEKEVALIKGTDFIDTSFDWNGRKATKEQSLNFPRINLRDSNGYEVEGIPLNLMKAVCVASLNISKGEDMFSVQDANGAIVSESVGSISTTYDVSKKEKNVTLYDEINLLLRGLYVDYTKQSIKRIKLRRAN